MDPITLIILVALGLASAGASAGVSAYNNAKNIEYQTQANAQNIEFQREVNEQAQYNLEHQHQIEVADLKAAGLNPVLSAGGQGAGQAYLNAPQAKAPQMDLSGVSSALGGIGHMATSMMMMQMFAANNAARNATLSAIANSKNAQSAANAALRSETVLTKQQMQNQFSQYNLSNQIGKGHQSVNSAKFMEEAAKEFGMSVKDFEKMIHYKWVKK